MKKKLQEIARKFNDLAAKKRLLDKAKKLGLNPDDVLEAHGYPNPYDEEFQRACDANDTAALWDLFQKSQKGSLFAKQVLRAILARLNGTKDVVAMWKVYHMTSGECDLAEEVLHKINLNTTLLQNWMEVIRQSKSGEDVHEEAIRLAKRHTDNREILWTLFKATENYALRKSILSKLIECSHTKGEFLQVLSVAEHGYPKHRNRCLVRLIELVQSNED